MKLLAILLGSFTMLFTLSTLLCGLWIKAKGLKDPASLNFHTALGIVTVVASLGSAILLILSQS